MIPDRDPLTAAAAAAPPPTSEDAPAPDAAIADRDIATILTLLRSARGWNQDDLAKASGMRNSSISDYERGRKVPELATLQRLLRALDLPLAAIDLTRAYLAALRGGIQPGALTPPLSWTQPIPPSGDAALAWEIEQAAAQLGGAHARVVRAGLLALRAHPPQPSDDPAAAAPAGNRDRQRAAPGQ